jgi:hypothetical protein
MAVILAIKSDFKTSPRAQLLCLRVAFNPQNTKCIPAVERYAMVLNPKGGFKTTSMQ